MTLKEKLKCIKINKDETVTSFLTCITQVRDQLATVGETVDPTKLDRTALNGLSKPWERFF